MTQKNRISAIIIARNEEVRIKRCMDGLAWTDEIVVVDNGSTDNTASVAKKLGAIVIEEKSHDFSKIRDFGARAAKGEWLLYVDADEIVTRKLQEEILAIIKNEKSYNAFFISRQNYYLGAPWPTRDGMVRLIRKNALIKWDGVLHEHAVVRGQTGTLQQCFIHDTHRSLDEMVTKTNEWSESEAALRFDHNHPPVSWWRFLRVMMTAFFNSYITQGGWKAGRVGWVESIYQAFSIFITYAKLWEMQQSNKGVAGKSA
jgi:glycosyltransferase involved in cell wall biosynthesis